jgi:hypothetical protein
VAYQVVGPILVLSFRHAERLTLSNPSGMAVDAAGNLIIRDGTEARFAWYYYGRPASPKNLCEEIYQKLGRGIVFTRIGPMSPTTVTLPFTGEDFVRLTV